MSPEWRHVHPYQGEAQGDVTAHAGAKGMCGRQRKAWWMTGLRLRGAGSRQELSSPLGSLEGVGAADTLTLDFWSPEL